MQKEDKHISYKEFLGGNSPKKSRNNSELRQLLVCYSRTKNTKYRDKIVYSCLPMVFKAAEKYLEATDNISSVAKPKADYDDLVQYGNLGLLESAEYFHNGVDDAKKWIEEWIFATMYLAVSHPRIVLYSGIGSSAQLELFRRECVHYMIKNGIYSFNAVSIEALSQALNKPYKTCKEYMEILVKTEGLIKDAKSDVALRDMSFEDSLPYTDFVEKQLLFEEIRTFTEFLEPDEQEVILSIFGYYDKDSRIIKRAKHDETAYNRAIVSLRKMLI